MHLQTEGFCLSTAPVTERLCASSRNLPTLPTKLDLPKQIYDLMTGITGFVPVTICVIMRVIISHLFLRLASSFYPHLSAR